MSSKSSKETVQKIVTDKKRPIDIQKVILSFSELIKHTTPLEIYNGKEKIPFSRRHSEYQAILRNEFAGELRKFFENVKKFS